MSFRLFLVMTGRIGTATISICHLSLSACGPGSEVGTATGYGLDGPGIESRWGWDFSAPVQTGPGAHPASCTKGYRLFPGGKERPGRDADPSPPLQVPWSWKSRAIPLLPLWAVRPVQSLSACTRVTFTLPFTLLSACFNSVSLAYLKKVLRILSFRLQIPIMSDLTSMSFIAQT